MHGINPNWMDQPYIYTKRKTFIKSTDFLIKGYKIEVLYPHGIYTNKSPPGKVGTSDQI